jgi:hypothetical protein
MSKRLLRRALVGLLALEVAGITGASFQATRWKTTDTPQGPVVQLRTIDLPQPLRFFAVHSFFVEFVPEEGTWHRVEIWDRSPPYLKKDLWPFDWEMVKDTLRVEREWEGEDALALESVLARSFESYPWREHYVAWPGPNCNTYAAWVLREAKVAGELPPRAVGKDYGCGVGWTTARDGFQAETPVAGVALGLREGVELHVGELALGLHLWPPAVATPLGRIGFSPSPR